MHPFVKTCLTYLAVLLFLPPAATAQKSWNLQWGNAHKPEFSGRINRIIHTDQQGYYALRVWQPKMAVSNKAHHASLELYNRQLDFVRSAALDLDYKGESLDFEEVVALGHQHFLLSSYYNAKQEKKYLLARPVNMQTLKNEGEYTKILEVESTSKLRQAYFQEAVSPDSSLLLVYGSLWFQQDKQEHFSLAVMDRTMKVLWTKDVVLPYAQKDIRIKDYAVDNQGNAYILASRNRSKKEKEDRDEYDIDYYIFAYLAGGTSAKEYKAALDQKYIAGFAFEVLNNGDLQCAGFYSDKAEWSMKGIFSYKINGTDGREYAKNIQPFGADILASDLSARRQEKAKNKDKPNRELGRYELRTLQLQSDGSTLLVGENYYISTVNTGKSTAYVAHSDDLLLVNLAPAGQIAWACKVDKKQSGKNEGYLFVPAGDQYYFIYKNGTSHKGETQLATVSATGQVKYAEFKPEGDDLESGTVLDRNTKTMIVWSDSKSKDRLGKIVFQ